MEAITWGEREFGREENVPIAGEYRRFGRYECTLGKLYGRKDVHMVTYMNDIASGAGALGDGKAFSK